MTRLLQGAGNIDFFYISQENGPQFRGDERMKKILLTLAALAFASPAAAQSIVVVTAQSPDSRVLPVAFAELPAGANDAAVAQLTTSDVDARAPSRLIHLVTASARPGRRADPPTPHQPPARAPHPP